MGHYLRGIGYTMEKYGICAYITNEFVVFPEAKPRVNNHKRVGLLGAYPILFHGVTDLYHTAHALVL